MIGPLRAEPPLQTGFRRKTQRAASDFQRVRLCLLLGPVFAKRVASRCCCELHSIFGIGSWSYDDRFTHMSLVLRMYPHKTSRSVPRGSMLGAVRFGLICAFDAALFEPLGGQSLVLVRL